MEPTEYARLLTNANAALREGYTKEEIDTYLQAKVGMTYKAVAAAVKAMPKETNPAPVTTEALLRAQAYGAVGPLAPLLEALVRSRADIGKWKEIKKNLDEERKAFEKDHPKLAGLYTGLGVALPAAGAAKLTGMGLRTAATLANKAGVPTAIGSGLLANPATVGAAQGAVGGAVAGTPFDQTAAGAATGAGLGTFGGMVSPLSSTVGPAVTSGVKKLLPLIGAGGAGAGLMNWLSNRGE